MKRSLLQLMIELSQLYWYVQSMETQPEQQQQQQQHEEAANGSKGLHTKRS
ncbi:hypothetical protein M758_7G004500 [Ceratodon purpureus]|nr:hypothetical protein M758_7G004500 [Ceratodon purpureus]